MWPVPKLTLVRHQTPGAGYRDSELVTVTSGLVSLSLLFWTTSEFPAYLQLGISFWWPTWGGHRSSNSLLYQTIAECAFDRTLYEELIEARVKEDLSLSGAFTTSQKRSNPCKGLS